MAQSPPFVLPPGVALRLTEKGLHLAYEGDVDLQETPEAGFALVEAGGDLEIRIPQIGANLRAGGTLRVRGDVVGGRLHARHVVLGRQRIDCQAITATESITIGAAHITCDAIIAPVIHLDPKAFGRVTVIESRNERGATKIKGGFSVRDFDDMFGNADEFLATRGLSRLPADAGAAPQRGTPTRAPARPEPPTSPLPFDEIDEDTKIVPATQPPATPRIASRAVSRSPAGANERNISYSVPNTPATYPPPPQSLPPGHPPSAPPPPRGASTEEEDDDP
ncbi:MAG: hypothetical protein AAF602_19315, partial [Myxococcota bacterium]